MIIVTESLMRDRKKRRLWDGKGKKEKREREGEGEKIPREREREKLLIVEEIG